MICEFPPCFHVTSVIQTCYRWFLKWHYIDLTHWRHFVRFLINIVSLISFARNGLLISHERWSMWYCFEKFILGKPINDNLFLLIKVDRRNIPQDNKNLTFLIFEIIWKWPLIIADIWINHYSVFTFAIQSLWYNFMPVLSFKFLFHFWVFLKCIDVHVSVFLLPQNLQKLGKICYEL